MQNFSCLIYTVIWQITTLLRLGVLASIFNDFYKIRLLSRGRVVSAIWIPNLLLVIILGSFSIALEHEALLIKLTLDATGISFASEIES